MFDNFGGQNFAYNYGKFQMMDGELNELYEDYMEREHYEFAEKQISSLRETLCTLIAMNKDLSSSFVKLYKSKYRVKKSVTYKDLKKFVEKEIDGDDVVTIIVNYNRRLMYVMMKKNNNELLKSDMDWVLNELFKEFVIAIDKDSNPIPLFDEDEMFILQGND